MTTWYFTNRARCERSVSRALKSSGTAFIASSVGQNIRTALFTGTSRMFFNPANCEVITYIFFINNCFEEGCRIKGQKCTRQTRRLPGNKWILITEIKKYNIQTRHVCSSKSNIFKFPWNRDPEATHNAFRGCGVRFDAFFLENLSRNSC